MRCALRRDRGVVGWWAAILSCALAACAPALNWREVRPEQTDGLQATFPCKPDAVERRLALPGLPEPVVLHVLSCQADGGMWVLSHLTVTDAAQVPVALRALAAATRGNVEAATRAATRQAGADVAAATVALRASELPPATVPGMTPQPDSRAWRFDALRPGEGGGPGVPMAVTAWHFSHGLTVFQASVWQQGEGTTAHSGREAVATFLQGFHFPG